MDENKTLLDNQFTAQSTAICEKMGIAKKLLELKKFPNHINDDIIFKTEIPDITPPETVYEDIRLPSWMTMPTPAENELYLLFHIPKDVSSLIAFIVEGPENGTYQLSFGTTDSNGVYTAKENYTKNFNEKYENQIYGSAWNTNLTENGMSQVIIRLKGEISGFSTATNSLRTNPENFCAWNIVDIVGNLPNLTKINMGIADSTNTKPYSTLTKLKYFKLEGTTKLTNLLNAFSGCTSLVAAVVPLRTDATVVNLGSAFKDCISLISVENFTMAENAAVNLAYTFNNCYSLTTFGFTNNIVVSDLTYTFYNCTSLAVLPYNMDTHLISSFKYMFYGCSMLENVPYYSLDSGTVISNMFYNCSMLKNLPALDTSNINDATSMFNGCNSLIIAQDMDFSNASSISNLFYNCYSLKEYGNLKVNNLTNVRSVFGECSSLSKLGSVDSVLNEPTYFFYNCYSLISIPKGLKVAGNINSMFYNCGSLAIIEDLEVRRVTKADNTFKGCSCLAKLTFSANSTPLNCDLNLSECAFGYKCLLNLFNTIPITENNSTLTITNNRGVSELTDADKQIVINKGWNLVT